MARLARQAQLEPIVRETALDIIGNFPSYPVAARRIRSFVAQRMRHINEGVETIHRPEWVLNQIAQGQRVWGDCDDEATLIVTLLLSIGIPPRLVAVRRSDRDFFEHVFAEGFLEGSWLMLDPRYAAMPAGEWTRMIVEV